MSNEHTFTMNLTPKGLASSVLLDGQDISHLLRGLTVRSDVDGQTTVELIVRKARVELIARVPEAQIVIIDKEE